MFWIIKWFVKRLRTPVLTCVRGIQIKLFKEWIKKKVGEKKIKFANKSQQTSRYKRFSPMNLRCVNLAENFWIVQCVLTIWTSLANLVELAYGDKVLNLSWFLLLHQSPQKMTLASKVVKIDSKMTHSVFFKGTVILEKRYIEYCTLCYTSISIYWFLDETLKSCVLWKSFNKF